MSKYSGLIGFAKVEETEPGVWVEQIIERTYYGDLTKISKRFDSSGHLNDNINLSNQLRILIDPFLNENLEAIRYVTFMNSKWKVSSAEVQYPALILTLGGVYNGQ